MELILAHVWNVTSGGHGTIHPSCRSCFEGTAKRWEADPVLELRLDEVVDADAEVHPQYRSDECFYCGVIREIEAKTDGKLRRVFLVCYRSGNTRSGVVYAEGNIMMDDGELFSRLDQLVTPDVVKIEFAR